MTCLSQVKADTGLFRARGHLDFKCTIVAETPEVKSPPPEVNCMLDFSDITAQNVVNYDFGQCYTRSYPSSPPNNRDLAAALIMTKGNYIQIANLLGRTRTSVKTAIEKSSELNDLKVSILDELLDELESDIFNSAKKGDAVDRRFLLTTLGKNRGYVTRGETTGKDGSPVVINFYREDENL